MGRLFKYASQIGVSERMQVSLCSLMIDSLLILRIHHYYYNVHTTIANLELATCTKSCITHLVSDGTEA